MKKAIQYLLLGAAMAASLPAAIAAEAAAVNQHFAAYYGAGKSVVDMAIAKKVDAAEVARKVDIMVTEAIWFAEEYAKIHTKGAKLLKTVTDHVGDMKKLPFKELEHNWHDLHYFDKANDTGVDLKAEENEHYTDPIHTLVHPLLVLKAAESYVSSKSEADLKSLKEEMEEGLEQLEKSKNVLLKK